MKIIKKIWHTCTITKRDAMAEINKRLQSYRATPHPTTQKSPAELMYGGRCYRTRLPEKKQTTPTEAVKEAQAKDRFNKEKQKKYKDKHQYVKPHNLKPGDKALLSQKQTKRNPPYDPLPYRITEVRGHQVTGQRNEKKVTRDAKKWKKLKENTPRHEAESWSATSSDDDILPGGTRERREPNQPEGAHCNTRGRRLMAEQMEQSDIEEINNEPTPTTPDAHTATEQEEIHTDGAATNQPTQEDRRVMRSQGLTLSWNPIMNGNDGPLATIHR